MRTNRFLIKQRPILQLYLIKFIQEERLYGQELLKRLREEFKESGFVPSSSEVYRALQDLSEKGILKREKVTKEGTEDKKYYQEIIYHRLSDEGQKKLELLRMHVKADLDRSHKIIEKALRDLY